MFVWLCNHLFFLFLLNLNAIAIRFLVRSDVFLGYFPDFILWATVYMLLVCSKMMFLEVHCLYSVCKCAYNQVKLKYRASVNLNINIRYNTGEIYW